MSITFKELIKDIPLSDIDHSVQVNLEELLKCVNIIRAKYGKPMIITSGLRSMQDHLRIYAAKGITDKSKIPMKSNHLIGAACDISDPKQELQKWILDNPEVLEEAGLYCEDFSASKTWVHFQCRPPKSGNRFFKP